MHRLVVCTFAFVATLAANSALADHHMKPVKDLKALEWLLGEYEITGIESGPVSSKYERISESFLKATTDSNNEGESKNVDTVVYGVDPKAKQVTAWAFVSEGIIAKGQVFSDGKVFEIRYKGNMPNGDDVAANFVVTKQEDGFTGQFKNMKMGDMEIPEGPVGTATRKKSQK